MTDLTALLRDLSEKAGKEWTDVQIPRGPMCDYFAACPPALIQALVAVVMAASDHYACHPDNTTHALIEALRRLEAVAQHLSTPRT